MTVEPSPSKPLPERKRIPKSDIGKFEPTPLYFYTEKDGLNRVTVLKELGKETYLIAGRYSTYANEARLYNPLTEEEKVEVEKLLRMGKKDAQVSFL